MVLSFGLVFPLGLAALVRGDTTRMYHMQLNRFGAIAVFVGWLSITFGSSVHFPGTNTTVKGLHGLSGLTVLIACCLQTVTGLARAYGWPIPPWLMITHSWLGKLVLFTGLSMIWSTLIWWGGYKGGLWFFLISAAAIGVICGVFALISEQR